MINIVIKNVKPLIEHRFIFMYQKNHINEYDIKNKLLSWSPTRSNHHKWHH